MVNGLTAPFGRAVPPDAGAFELQRQGGSWVDLNVATSIVSGRSVAVLPFAGPGIIGNSPADGSYTLTIRSDRVLDGDGTVLDGGGSAGGDRTEAFFRLFGHSDGDRDHFGSAVSKSIGEAGYLWYFDFDADVGGPDNV
jgi:hypothetical protein